MDKVATDEHRWVSYKEAEGRFSVSRWTLLRWAKSGDIRAARVGGLTLLDMKSIEEFLAERAAAFPRK